MTNPAPPVTFLAPAKLNLGLEILGRRPDGYHEIRSVMTAIGLCDRLAITPHTDDDAIQIDGVPDVAQQDNLVWRAIVAFRDRTGIPVGYRVAIDKRIPSPGGLGGASTDAAATLRALNDMLGEPLDNKELIELTVSLGSDVPFFLGQSTALASGTGTDLTPLPPVQGFAVLLAPMIQVPTKTATLYRALTPADFTDGERARRVAASIGRGDLPDADDLANAFTRPLYTLAPNLQTVAEAMVAQGAPYAALTGAGPAHYALYREETDAHELADRLRSIVPDGTLVAVTALGPRLPLSGR